MSTSTLLKIGISVPSGFNARELLLPISQGLESDPAISEIVCISPAAEFRDELFSTYSQKFTFVRQPSTVEDMVALVKQHKLQAVVTPTTGLDPNDVVILQGAAQASIPTITFISSWDNVFKMGRAVASGRPYALPTHFLVWNEMMRAHLLRLFKDVSALAIHVVGAPRFDFFSHHDKIPTREELLRYLALPDDGSKLIHLATTELYPMDYIVREIWQAGHDKKLHCPVHLYASVHPGGVLARHEGYATKYGVTVRYSFGRRDTAPVPEFLYNPTLEDVYMLVALFKHSDVLVNHSSTVAIESFVADVPVINVKYGQRFDWWRWHRSMVYRDFNEHYRDIIDSGATTVVHTGGQLISSINEYLQNPSYKSEKRAAAAKKMISYVNGEAAEIMLTTIKKIAVGPARVPSL